jgi:hypothetical protein
LTLSSDGEDLQAIKAHRFSEIADPEVQTKIILELSWSEPQLNIGEAEETSRIKNEKEIN